MSTLSTHSTTGITSTATLLATAKARIISPITSMIVRILIDSGSEISLISENVVRQLGLHRTHSSLVIMGFGATSKSQSRGMIQCKLQSLHSEKYITLQAHVTTNITTILPSHHATNQEWPHIKSLQLADDTFLTPQPIDIILGVNHYPSSIKANIIRLHEDMPIAQLSIFGWLVLGPCGHHHSVTSRTNHLTIQQEHESLQELLTKFWVQEEVPIISENQLTPEELQCELHFKETHQRHSTGKYIVRLPLRGPRDSLGDSYYIAKKCLLHLKSRLDKNPEYYKLYDNFMNEYINLGHMVKASSHFTNLKTDTKPNWMTLAHDTSVSGGLRVQGGRLKSTGESHNVKYYLPHHGVLKPESTSTKLRVVFNGSKATSSGTSLNDIMHTGSKIQRDITDVLLWIRKHQFIFTTDVTKMYRQIMVHEDDWDLQRILWFDENGHITPYNLTTVTYGTRAAPFLAIRALLQLAQDEGKKFPLAVEPIVKGRYVDDIIGGADTPTKLLEIANQLTQLCNAGGLPLAKWQFNDQSIHEKFTNDQKTLITTSPITFGDCTETKILGLIWNPIHDHFKFSIKKLKSKEKISKRTILSEVAQIYDPLGFISPITIRAKLLMQELWLEKFNWDDTLPITISTRWMNFKQELTALENIVIPRWSRTLESSTCELHGFSDASQLAMSAVVYLKVNSTSDTQHVTLLCAKTKVAPLKRLTIPRLELAAALLLAKLIQYVTATIEVNVTNVYLWTDSSVTLAWIKSHPSKWKDFVRNRVTQIQELTSSYHWLHVPGKSNPADCASRGTSTQHLIDHSLWWAGPPWLSKSERHWPVQPETLDDSPSQEARPGISSVMTISPSNNQWDLISKYSNFTKLIRVTSHIMKACEIFKNKSRSPLEKSISPNDLDRAKQYWIRSTQQAYFNQELKQLMSNQRLPQHHVLSTLTAFIDVNGILRVGGRLEHSSLTFTEKHPAILPRHSPLSTLIIDHYHKATLHGGTQITLSTIRQHVWIIGGRAPVKSYILKCMRCARQRGIRAQQLMGQLPSSRVNISRPFQHTGLDYAGPVNIKSWKGRGSKSYKAWICLFICMTTSAIHIETVTDYTTDGFLAAYKRFTSRRGVCQALYSDCGTNFIGADAELKKLFNQASKEHHHIKQIIMNDQTQWHFNPPGAPHMGGKWEAGVKSIKSHLKRTITDTLLTLEEFNTLLIQIEGILNSRPLEPLSDDPNDVMALTPGHFLIGSPISAIPHPSLVNLNPARLSSWQHIQNQVQHFWKRWSTSVLQRYLATTKWKHHRNDIKVGDLVLLTDERFPPSKWPLARVTKLHPGSDGLTRVVTIKTSSTTLTRPITKLALLPSTTTTSPDNILDNHQLRC